VVLDPKLDGRYLPALSPPAPPGVLKGAVSKGH